MVFEAGWREIRKGLISDFIIAVFTQFWCLCMNAKPNQVEWEGRGVVWCQRPYGEIVDFMLKEKPMVKLNERIWYVRVSDISLGSLHCRGIIKRQIKNK